MSWSDILNNASEMRFSGIEIYNVFKTPEFVAKGGPFNKYSLMASLRDLREQGMCYVKHERKQSCFHITVR